MCSRLYDISVLLALAVVVMSLEIKLFFSAILFRLLHLCFLLPLSQGSFFLPVFSTGSRLDHQPYSVCRKLHLSPLHCEPLHSKARWPGCLQFLQTKGFEQVEAWCPVTRHFEQVARDASVTCPWWKIRALKDAMLMFASLLFSSSAIYRAWGVAQYFFPSFDVICFHFLLYLSLYSPDYFSGLLR